MESICNWYGCAQEPHPAMRLRYIMRLQLRRRPRSRQMTSYQNLREGTQGGCRPPDENPDKRIGSSSFIARPEAATKYPRLVMGVHVLISKFLLLTTNSWKVPSKSRKRRVFRFCKYWASRFSRFSWIWPRRFYKELTTPAVSSGIRLNGDILEWAAVCLLTGAVNRPGETRHNERVTSE